MAGGSRSELGSSRGDATVRRLGRYQIIGRLATGGMAEVYLALSGDVPGFRTLVVVKRILPHLASNAQFIRMFLDEARLAALLDHPNIVRIIEVGHDGEDYFLVMELVQGKPLSAVLRKAAREHKPPSPALTSYLISQAAHGLAYAHTLTDGDGRPLGVVHRDVSPQNVLISFEGAVKMIDFGVARAFGRVAHTSPGGLKGKIDYMSPEQASAEEVDHRADVFALGVVLWEALTGRRLFRRETELATMRAIVDDPIPHPAEIAPSIPADLDAIVMRALRKRKDARYASAQEMAAALERFAFSNDGFRRCRSPPTRSRCSRPSTCSGGRPRRRRWTWRWRTAQSRRWRASAPNRRRPGRRWRCGRASRGRKAAARCAAPAAAAAAAAAPARARQRQRGSQSAYSRSALGRRPGGRDGRRRGAEARSHLAVRRRRRVAGHRRRRRLDVDAAPGDLGLGGQPAAPAAPAAMVDRSTSSRRRRPHRSRRSRARPRNLRRRLVPRPSCRPCRRSQPRFLSPGPRPTPRRGRRCPVRRNPSRAAVTNVSAPAHRPKRTLTTTKTRRRRQLRIAKSRPLRGLTAPRPTRSAARFRYKVEGSRQSC